jgi:hypothetical protein
VGKLVSELLGRPAKPRESERLQVAADQDSRSQIKEYLTFGRKIYLTNQLSGVKKREQKPRLFLYVMQLASDPPLRHRPAPFRE